MIPILKIFAPQISVELGWICSVIFNEFLGIEYVIETVAAQNFKLQIAHNMVELPNVFFPLMASHWLESSSLPASPLNAWDCGSSQLEAILTDPRIPVVFGDGENLSVVTDNYIYLPVDILGSAFFLMSHYEEAISPERDMHDRFPAAASLAFRERFLHRPIVDEYVEILWAAIKRLCPQIERRSRKARTLISCDVDLPYDPACASIVRMGKRVLGRTWREKSLCGFTIPIKNYLGVKRGDFSFDPYRSALDWIMDENEAAGNQVAFYFIPERTDAQIDNSMSLDLPQMRALLCSVHQRGHEIGIHPGYNTYRNPNAFGQSVTTLRRVLQAEGIKQTTLGGRQHYLRWSALNTPQLWEANGLTYDTTLSFDDRPGFRCGTCHEYPMYDLANRRPLKLRQRPLIMMEGSRYQGLTADPLNLMLHYKQLCHRFNGDFTLLWHNSYFENRATKEMYREVIKHSQECVKDNTRHSRTYSDDALTFIA